MYIACRFCGHRDHISEFGRAGKYDFVCPNCHHLISLKGENSEERESE